EPFWRHAAIQAAIEHHGRAAGAPAQAIYWLQREAAVSARLMEIDAEARPRVRSQSLAPNGLAGFGLAETNHMPTSRLGAEIVIDADDAMPLGARQVECVSNRCNGFAGNVAQAVLNGVQDRQQGSFPVAMSLDGFADCAVISINGAAAAVG